MSQVEARHILLESEEKCSQLLIKLHDGADFAQLAKENSICPSKIKGGELGLFSRGKMVKEFDTVVFSADVGVYYGPVKTEFGYHIVEVTYRC